MFNIRFPIFAAMRLPFSTRNRHARTVRQTRRPTLTALGAKSLYHGHSLRNTNAKSKPAYRRQPSHYNSSSITASKSSERRDNITAMIKNMRSRAKAFNFDPKDRAFFLHLDDLKGRRNTLAQLDACRRAAARAAALGHVSTFPKLVEEEDGTESDNEEPLTERQKLEAERARFEAERRVREEAIQRQLSFFEKRKRLQEFLLAEEKARLLKEKQVLEEKLRRAEQERLRMDRERKVLEAAARRVRQEEKRLMQEQREGKALQGMRQEEAYHHIQRDKFQRIQEYETKWNDIKANKPIEGFPWPVFCDVNCPADITEERMREFFSHPSPLRERNPRRFINNELLRWHPDKISWLLDTYDPVERQQAKDIIKSITRLLTGLRAHIHE